MGGAEHPGSWRGGGVCYGHRFNPDADPERQLVAGLDWMQGAQDRAAWGAMTEAFVAEFDVPWASRKQNSLHNIAPNKRDNKRTSRPMKPRLTAGGEHLSLPAQ